MSIILTIVAGLILAAVCSVVLSIAAEMLLSIGELHAVWGGFGFFFLAPIAMVGGAVATFMSYTSGDTGFALFFSPLLGVLAVLGILTALGFLEKLRGNKKG